MAALARDHVHIPCRKQNTVPCDFFGAHVTEGIYDDEAEDLLSYAKKYYGEIMMPFNRMGKSALEKIKDLKIEMIAPSHGPIYKNPERILSEYRKWTAGETKEKALIVYVSMWKATESMTQTMIDTLVAEGIEVSFYNLTNADLGDVAKDLVDARAIVLGARPSLQDCIACGVRILPCESITTTFKIRSDSEFLRMDWWCTQTSS